MDKPFCRQQLLSRRSLFIIVIMILGLLLVSYIHQYNTIVTLRQEQLRVQTQIDLTKNFLKAHPNIASDEQAMAEHSAKIERYLPDNLAIDQFIAQLAAAAANSDTKIVALTIGQASQAETVKTVSIQVKLEGSYLGVLEFLRKLERVERVFSIDTWEISRAKEALNCNIFIKIYEYLPINIEEKQEYDK